VTGRQRAQSSRAAACSRLARRATRATAGEDGREAEGCSDTDNEVAHGLTIARPHSGAHLRKSAL